MRECQWAAVHKFWIAIVVYRTQSCFEKENWLMYNKFGLERRNSTILMPDDAEQIYFTMHWTDADGKEEQGLLGSPIQSAYINMQAQFFELVVILWKSLNEFLHIPCWHGFLCTADQSRKCYAISGAFARYQKKDYSGINLKTLIDHAAPDFPCPVEFMMSGAKSLTASYPVPIRIFAALFFSPNSVIFWLICELACDARNRWLV